jgi:hypothetical protein
MMAHDWTTAARATRQKKKNQYGNGMKHWQDLLVS